MLLAMILTLDDYLILADKLRLAVLKTLSSITI